MAEKRQKTKKHSAGRPKSELYLKIPYHILNIPKLRPAEKVLLAHIYSFGAKGCWQSNETLATMFMITPRTITKYIANLQKKGLVQIDCPKGYYRKIHAKSHPDVKAGSQFKYKCKEVEKSSNLHRTKQRGQCAKERFRLSKKLLPTNNKTIKETIREIGATPTPAHPKGAPALLVERERKAGEEIQKFMKSFGRGKKKKYQPISEKEFQKRKEVQKKALLGGK